MAYWLLKSEPGVFSIDDLAAAPGKKTGWEGVRNYQARNHMRAMKKGDLVFFYHSNATPSAIVGIAEIAREAYPDPFQFDKKSRYHDPRSDLDNPRWSLVDIRFKERFKTPITLDSIKGNPKLKKMVLVNNSRLSVQPVSKEEWTLLIKLGQS